MRRTCLLRHDGRVLPIPSELLVGPFTLERAIELGVSRRVLQGKRFRRLHRGVYAHIDVDLTTGVRTYAATLVLPAGSAASGHTGLQLWGADVGPARPLHFATTHPHQIRVDGVTTHRVDTLGELWTARRGYGVQAAQTCWASARLSLLDQVIAGDWLLHLQRCRLTDLRDTPRTHRALRHVRPKVESQRETYVRLLLTFAGLPDPQCNNTIGDAREPLARLDMSYPDFKIAVEYDGRQHNDKIRQRRRDLARREALDAIGWRVIVVEAHHLRHPREVAQRVQRAMAARGYAGPPPRFDRQWQSMFQVADS